MELFTSDRSFKRMIAVVLSFSLIHRATRAFFGSRLLCPRHYVAVGDVEKVAGALGAKLADKLGAGAVRRCRLNTSA